jgi:hypothetical protein
VEGFRSIGEIADKMVVEMSDDADERFKTAILNFCAGKTFEQRMHLIAGILSAFGDLEAAGDNPRGARVLFSASTRIEALKGVL